MAIFKSRYTVIIVFVVSLFCLNNIRVIQSASLIDHEISIQAGAEYVPGQLLVRFAPKEAGKQLTVSEKNQLLTTLGGSTLKHEFDIVPGLTLVKLPQGQKVMEALKIYCKTSGILYAEPDYKIEYVSMIPNDTYISNLWGMNNTGSAIYNPIFEYKLDGLSYADIDAAEAWRINSESSVVVAVIDSGIDYNHPDLADNIWRNPIEEPNDANNDGYPGIAGVDDDGDGLIDEDSEGFYQPMTINNTLK